MATLEMDTDKIRAEGENLKAIARDYNNLLNGVFDKIADISNKSWSGDSNDSGSNQFISKVLADKANMQSLSTSMNDLGNMIINYANNVNNSADNL